MLAKNYPPFLDPTTQTPWVTLVRRLPADLETPVSAYLKLVGGGPSFLLESVTGGEQVARYSFIGVDLQQSYVLRGRNLEIHTSQGLRRRSLDESPSGSPLDLLRQEIGAMRPSPIPGLPRFAGGLVGYLGYETACFYEPSIPSAAAGDGLPDAIFLLADTLVAFDHAYGRLLLIAHAPLSDERGGLQLAKQQASARLDELVERLSHPLPPEPFAFHPPVVPAPAALTPESGKPAFIKAVRRARQYITAGDLFQVVLSQRFRRQTQADPFDIYRALRGINPSPYMFYFDFADLAGEQPLRLIGASPEMQVRLEGRMAAIRPIAGTRRRGASPDQDQALQAELLADPKERAEHVMLVDLARNDLGRVCSYGSVQVSELMGVERYSHVMHIVSHVEGQLRPGLDGFDLMQATFPAGTVSGAPKVRAMQRIAELEGVRRGPYAGAVGYFSCDGSLDTCIAIRTLVMQGQSISIQAGAGIVADSDPEREYQETCSKAGALAAAVQAAENGLKNISKLPEGGSL